MAPLGLRLFWNKSRLSGLQVVTGGKKKEGKEPSR